MNDRISQASRHRIRKLERRSRVLTYALSGVTAFIVLLIIVYLATKDWGNGLMLLGGITTVWGIRRRLKTDRAFSERIYENPGWQGSEFFEGGERHFWRTGWIYYWHPFETDSVDREFYSWAWNRGHWLAYIGSAVLFLGIEIRTRWLHPFPLSPSSYSGRYLSPFWPLDTQLLSVAVALVIGLTIGNGIHRLYAKYGYPYGVAEENRIPRPP